MGKGFAVTTMVELVIAAIILFLLVPPLFGVFKEVYAAIMQSLGLIKYSNIEEAMKCSYYRCVEGCASPRMLETKWTEGGDTVDCNKYCQDPLKGGFYEGDDLKVCGENADRYPVKVEVKTDTSETISKDHVSNIATPDNCIVYLGTDWTGIIPEASDSYVYVNKDDLTKIEDWYCIDQPLSHLPAIKSANIKSGTVYIYTYRGCPSGAMCNPVGNPLITEISKRPPQVAGCKPNNDKCNSNSECCSDYCNPSGICSTHEIKH